MKEAAPIKPITEGAAVAAVPLDLDQFQILHALSCPAFVISNDVRTLGRECEPLFVNHAYLNFRATRGRLIDQLTEEQFDDLYSKVLSGSFGTVMTVSSNGETSWLRLVGRPIAQGVLVTIDDLTAEYQAKFHASQQEALYRRLVEASSEGYWEHDLLTRERTWCPRIRALLGLSADEPITEELRQSLCHPDDYLKLSVTLQQHLDLDEPLRAECRFLLPNGEYRWVVITGTAVRDPDGRPVKLLGTFQDVHERRNSEEKAIEMNRLLETRIAQRTRELADTNAELQSFCYSVSHDLRGPLRSINGFGKALEEEFAETLGPEGRDYVGRIRKASLRLSGLIDALLSLSRITRAEMRRERLNVGELFREAFDDQQRANPTRIARLQLDGDLNTYGDINLLRLVANNLMENAWKFSAREAETVIQISRISEAFCVRDNGAGFDMAFASKLFAPFERLHTEHEFPGTGIGLAVVQRVIQRHMGEIWAQSEPGCGAAFYFTLPSRKESRVSAENP